MSEKFDTNSTNRGQLFVNEHYGEAPDNVDVIIYNQMKSAVADFIDRKITFTDCYKILQALINPDSKTGMPNPGEATKAIIQRELDLMYASYL